MLPVTSKLNGSKQTIYFAHEPADWVGLGGDGVHGLNVPRVPQLLGGDEGSWRETRAHPGAHSQAAPPPTAFQPYQAAVIQTQDIDSGRETIILTKEYRIFSAVTGLKWGGELVSIRKDR